MDMARIKTPNCLVVETCSMSRIKAMLILVLELKLKKNWIKRAIFLQKDQANEPLRKYCGIKGKQLIQKLSFYYTHLYRTNSDNAAAAASLWYFWGRSSEFLKNRQIFCTYVSNKTRMFVKIFIWWQQYTVISCQNS